MKIDLELPAFYSKHWICCNKHDIQFNYRDKNTKISNDCHKIPKWNSVEFMLQYYYFMTLLYIFIYLPTISKNPIFIDMNTPKLKINYLKIQYIKSLPILRIEIKLILVLIQ